MISTAQRWVWTSWSALLALIGCTGALAQGFPAKPITLVWVFPPSAIEAPIRALAEEAGKLLGQPMLIDIRPGAGGRIGVNSVVRSPADGYTIGLFTDPLLTTLPQASANYKVEMGRDYVPVQITMETASMLNGHTSLPFRDLRGLIAYAKANPGKLTFGSSGIGGAAHINLERLAVAAGIQFTHVPYKGAGQALADRLSGVCNLWMGAADFQQHVADGKLFPIATTGTTRVKEFPDTPTLAEAGLPGLTLKTWFAMIAPPGTSPEIVTRLNRALNAAIKSPEVIARMEKVGFIPVGSTPEEMATRVRTDSEVNGPIVRKLGLRFDD